MEQKYNINDINILEFSFKMGDIVFLNWDLGAWKTTISKYILNNILSVKENITSPTYTYYNKYEWILDWKKINIYHFDLYRLNNYDEFFAIWAEEILDDNNWIILIEWPDIIKRYYNPNLIINLFKLENEDERKIEIIKK
jgi:tRNA threonylcarbamoyladenosine biosynthesis protein TsaE